MNTLTLFTITVYYSNGTPMVRYFSTEKERDGYIRTYLLQMEMFPGIVTGVVTGSAAVSVRERYTLVGIDPETRDVCLR